MSPRQPKSAYHHGNLRQELLDACLRLIREEGVGAVSMRRVAREAGVSPGAPYHHFADRAAMLAELVIIGFRWLGEHVVAARQGAANPTEALLAMLDAYVGFAVANHAHFVLMFRPELCEPDRHPDVHAAGEEAFGLLTEPMAAWQREGLLPATELTGLVMSLWSMGHGIALLWIDGHLEKRCTELGTTPEEMLTRVKHTVAALLEAQTAQ